jgi:hypothetical protein
LKNAYEFWIRWPKLVSNLNLSQLNRYGSN